MDVIVWTDTKILVSSYRIVSLTIDDLIAVFLLAFTHFLYVDKFDPTDAQTRDKLRQNDPMSPKTDGTVLSTMTRRPATRRLVRGTGRTMVQDLGTDSRIATNSG